MSKISCDTCLDLMPLVKDGIASSDSENLVIEHIDECENCQKIFAETSKVPIEKANDKRITRNIKKNILFSVITLLLMGFSWAIILSDRMNMFYNAIIMPTIGGLGYILFKKKAYISPLAVFISSFIFDFITAWNDMSSTTEIMEKISLSTMNGIFYGFIYTFFCLIGVAIAWCFNYAFKKENQYENKD